MKFTAKRLLAAGAIGISAIVTPLSLTVALSGVGTAPSSVAGASSFDQIDFNQTAAGDSFQYIPASGGGPAPQAVTVGGKCPTSTPTVPPSSGPAYLNVCGQLYSSNSYTGTPTAGGANIGSNGPVTGVAAISPAWTIDNKSNKGAEALDFSPNPNASGVIGSNRTFTEATIPITRKDTGVTSYPFFPVELAELGSTGNVLGTVDCTLTGNTGTTIIVDTGNSGSGVNGAPSPQCHQVVGPAPTTFNAVEVRDLQTSTSISVGPGNAIFKLADTVCGGQTVNANATQGGAQVSLTLNEAGTVCKSFSAFTSTTSTENNYVADSVEFDAFASTDLHFTALFVWPPEAYCTPDGSTPPTPACPPDTVTYNDPVTGQNVTGDQTYCAAATEVDQLCAVNKTYNYLDPQTTVAVGSNGLDVTTLKGSGTLSVVSTSGLLASGQVTVVTSGGLAALSYTGLSGNTLTGVKLVSGSGIVSTGAAVAQTAEPSTTVATGSNGLDVTTLKGSGTLSVSSTSGFLASGQVTVATSGGSPVPALLSYTGITNNTFTGVTALSGSGTLSTGAPVVAQDPATTVAAGSAGVDVSTLSGSLSVVDASGLLALGQVTVATTNGSGSAVLSYTGISGNTLTGVALVSGSGTLALGGAVDQHQTVIIENYSGLLDWLVGHG